MSLFYCALLGLAITGLIIWITEYYTGTGKRPVNSIAEASITGLSEEHGNVTLHGASPRPKVGDKVRVVPNHSCVVSNLTDRVVFHRSGEVLRHEDVAARGCVV